MRKKINQLTAMTASVSLMAALINVPYIAYAEKVTYTSDFAQLVKDGADTMYGTADDVFTLDDYTTASLTYEGTYVSADGKVYLNGSGANKGNGEYVKGSYIEFTAPADGTVTFDLNYANYFIDGAYQGYNSTSVQMTEGQKLQIGSRASNRSCVSSLAFEYETAGEEPEVTDSPTGEPDEPGEFTLPALWDFTDDTTKTEGVNVPVLGGNAVWVNGEVQFPADTTSTGQLSLELGKAVKDNVVIEFDSIGHEKALGQQWFNFSISNSEESIIDLQVHPYDSTVSAKGLSVCGTTIADGAAIYSAWSGGGTRATHIKTEIDFDALKAKVTIGSTEFTGDIPEAVYPDVKNLTIWSNRSKTAAPRYISVDNLSIDRFTSTEPPAERTITNGYIKESIAGFDAQVKEAPGKPAVIYLCGKTRFGTDGYGQLYDAQPVFDALSDAATLIAPQSAEAFTDISELGAEVQSKYNAPSVTVIGQAENAPAALSSGADKIITIAGTGTAKPEGSVWAFAGYEDAVTSVADVRAMVNALQKDGTRIRYTEYPFGGHKINSDVAGESGLVDWILGTTEDKKVVDLVLFSGQSNMAGRGDYEDAAVLSAGEGYEYHSVTEPGVLSAVKEPFGKYENNSNINDAGSNGIDRRSGDMVTSLMKAYYDKTGVPMVGVQASRGGTKTKYWLTAAQYNEAIGRYNEAAQYLEDNGYTIRKKLLVWCQGEGDADSESFSKESYKTNTLKIFDTLKKGTGITDTFIVRTGHYNINYGLSGGAEPGEAALASDSRYIAASEAQAELAAENDNIYEAASFLSDFALENMRDQYHYYQTVYNAVGKTAGEAIGAVYSGEEIPTPPPTNTPTPKPEATATPSEGIDYKWDFETNQTAASGNNVPVISGSAVYDAENKMVRLSAVKTNDNSVTVNLSPAASGVVTTEFDAYIASLGNTFLNVTANDNSGNELVKLALDTYNNNGTVTIGGVEVCSDEDLSSYFNKVSDNGIKAAATHFVVEINTATRTASLTMSKSGSEGRTFTGAIKAESVGSVSVSRTSANKNDVRASYIDNISISSYVPEPGIFVTGASSVAKRMGMAVTEKYEISKTYADDTDVIEWSVSGVEGVTINKDTGVMTVAENAATGTAKVTATLTKSGTLPAGTTDSMDVTVKDFPQPADYTLGGSTTIETGRSETITLEKLLDTDGNDITEFAVISEFTSKDSTVASVDENGVITAIKAGNTEISFKLTVEKLGYSRDITIPVKIGAFEITSSDNTIDVSSLISYGADTYRVYNGTKSQDVKADSGRIANPYGGEVTVVPVYRMNYTSAAISGYTTATGKYDAATGYGLIDGINYNANENGIMPVSGRPIRIDLPYGSYDMNILRKGGSRCDVYNDDIQIINNTTSSGSQNRSALSALMYAPQILVEDGSADITFGNTSGANERIATVEIVRVPDKYKKQIIWIAGDSEAANYYPINDGGDDLDSDKIMMTGFGMQLPKFLSEDYYKVANWGQPSATIGTWSDECMESAVYRMEKGDTIIIDFGINDAISSLNATTADVMKERIKELIGAAQAKGVQPILVSPLWNSKYQSKSYFTYNGTTNDMYAFAEECGVPCIDLNKGTMAYKDNAVAATGDSAWVANNYHVGDNLHQTQFSALLNAAIIAGGMKQMGYITTDYSYTYKDCKLDTADASKRGEETGVTREYSIAALADYITVKGKKIEVVPPEPPTVQGISVSGDEVTVALDNVNTAVLIAASYDEKGALTGIKTYPLGFVDGKAKVNITADYDKLYVWDSIEDMQPLTKAYTAPEITPEPMNSTQKPTTVPTVKPTVKPTVAPTDEPSKVLYEQNFEGFSVGDSAGWTSPAGTVSVKNDTSSGIGKYQTVVSGKSGTCRSGYIEIPAVIQNFVFECDYKSSGNANVSDLELVESKSSIYANHGVYSNQNFAFTMARPSASDCYVINNKADDSNFKITSYADPVFTSKNIPGNPWIHVKVVGSFDTQKVIVYITSLDGKTEYLHGMYDMNNGRGTRLTSWRCIHLLSPSTNTDTCIDNIKVRTAVASDLAPVYHKVKMSLGTYSFEQYVADGESVINIPSIEKYGTSFEGWRTGSELLSTEELKKYGITFDCEITGSISSSYIEALSEVEFKDFPADNELVMGADENTYGDNIISLSIRGEQGTSLVTNPDERVKDYKIEWSFDGFRTLDGAPTGETGEKYCDSYGIVEITETAQSSVNFRLKKTAANYWGRVTARVTYNGNTVEVTRPLVLLGDKSGDNILPPAGYPADFNKYEDSMVGYRLSSNDSVLGGWSSAGSDSTYMELKSDSTGKYISLSRALSGNSSYVYNTVGQITAQTVFEQDVRFGMDGTISYMDGVVTESRNNAFDLSYSGGTIKLNNVNVYSGASGNTWYHIAITADPTTKLCRAAVYDMSGRLLGECASTSFGSTYTSGKYYRVTLAKQRGSIDINNVKVYTAEIDSNTFKLTMPEAAAIPESGETEVSISAAAKTTAGDAAIGLVEWAIADELAEGVKIISTGSASAKLVISDIAASGSLPICAVLGGKSVTGTIKLTGTKDNVAFVSAPAGIQLGAAGEYEYSAEVRNGNAEIIEDRTITYSLCRVDGTDASVSGITIDRVNGKMTVSANVSPQTVYIKAASVDSSGNTISRITKTVLYSLKFSFGSTAPTDSSYTQVTADTVFNAARGFGIEGTATNENNAITANGAVFKVKLEKGRVYSVKAKYEGTIRCERVNSDFPGFDRKKDKLSEDTYKVAVFGDDIMDITLLSGGRLASVEITPVTKTAAAKPDWWTIGDSTVQQNGSWGYTIAATETTNLSKYPELSAKVSGFHNSGKAGEQHKNFYTNGRLNAILTEMNPGDVVSLSGMGTNDSSSTLEQFYEYDEMYINAVMDMGGRVILGSYTPTGNYGSTKDKVYDADTMTFKGMRTNAYDRAIRELYEDYKDNAQVLGFVDIGAMADEKMTADVKAEYDAAVTRGAGEAGARAAANAKAEEMMAWWKDYNHYYTTFADYILPNITKAVAGLI